MQTIGKFGKVDLRLFYGDVSIEVFESWIEDIMDEIGWVKGKKQVFPPKVARRIFEHIGLPDNIELLNP